MNRGDVRGERRELIRGCGVYLVTEESLSGGRRSEEIVEAVLEAGVRVVQVREKQGPARRAWEIARAARAATSRHGALLLVNDRVDLALAVGADGVHVGQEDLPLAVARRLLGLDAVIGLSITDAIQLGAADARDADYLGVGAVFPTGSKPGAALTGLPLLAASRRAHAVPIVAIGGVTSANAPDAIGSGADAVAVIGAIVAAPDPAAAARTLLAAVTAARASAAAPSRIGVGRR